VPYLRRYSPTNLCDGAQMAIFWRFLGPVFPASRVQHASDLHPKFALRHANLRRLRLGEERKKKKEEEKEKTTGQKYNVRICYAGRP